jgi:membrane-associated phospholipid phosphatase
MTPSRSRIARDYNRGLPPPIRLAHIGWSFIAPPFEAFLGWVSAPNRAWWARPTVLAVIAFFVLFPFDGPVLALVERYPPVKDVAVELRAWQQFGAVGSIIFVALLIRLLDPAKTRRLFDLAAIVIANALFCLVLKMAIGRPRPDSAPFLDAGIILGPFGAYPLGPEVGIRYAWEFWAGITSRLWSIPSSHTASAAALAVFLNTLYPRLRPVTILLVCIVGIARIAFRDHWPTDVTTGLAAGIIAARAALRYRWGDRLARVFRLGTEADRNSGPEPTVTRQDAALTPASTVPRSDPLHSAP